MIGECGNSATTAGDVRYLGEVDASSGSMRRVVKRIAGRRNEDRARSAVPRLDRSLVSSGWPGGVRFTARRAASIAVYPFRPLAARLIQTVTADLKPSVMAKTAAVTADRMARLGGTVAGEMRCPHDVERVSGVRVDGEGQRHHDCRAHAANAPSHPVGKDRCDAAHEREKRRAREAARDDRNRGAGR